MATRKSITPKKFNEITADKLKAVLLDGWKKENSEEWGRYSPEKQLLLETLISDIAAHTLTNWERKLRAFNISAPILTEPTLLRATLTNPLYGAQDIYYPPTYTEVLTGHPTSSLNLETIKAMHDLQTHLEQMDKDTILNLVSGQVPQLEVIKDRVGSIAYQLDPAQKLDTMEETRRASYFAKQRYEAIPILMLRVDQVDRAYSENVTKRNPVSIEELERMPTIRLKSWQLDRDSKPNVTARVIEEEAVTYNMAETRCWNEEAVRGLAKQLREGADNAANIIALQIAGGALNNNELKKEFEDTAERQRVFIAGVKVYIAEKLEALLPYRHAEALRNGLAALKAELQEKGYEKHIPKLYDNGVESRYSLLDAVYKQVHTAGDCYPQLEVRQNARMHQRVLQHVRDIMKEPDAEGRRITHHPELAERPNLTPLITMARATPQLGRIVRERVEEYYRPKDENMLGVENYYRLKEQRAAYAEIGTKNIPDDLEKQIAKYEKDEQFQSRLAFYETLKAYELIAKYPHTIGSYVIAETGVVKEEEGRSSKSSMRTKAAAQAREDTLTPLFFLELMTDPAHRINGKLPKLEIIPLLETRDSIISANELFINLFTNPIFQAEVQNNTAQDIPQIFDKQTGAYRTMTVADAKRDAGIVPFPEDEQRELHGKLTVMFAGSDSMRENGPCIGPLNAHNQEKLYLQALEQGYLVEIYQGVGGAVHRSNPASFHAAQQTTQGSVNHISTPETIAHRGSSHLAAAMMDGYRHHLDPAEHAKYYNIAARYPGHLGNAMMLKPEEKEIREQTFQPLMDGCRAHAAMFDDPAYDTFIQKASGLDYTKWCNYSARPDQRQDRAFSAASLRAIGYNLALFSMGANTTLWKGIGEFMGLDKETGNFDLARTQNFLENSSKIQDMMTRTVFGLAIADYDIAWKFQDVTRHVNEKGETILEKAGRKVRLDKLLEGDVAEKTKQVFGDEAIVLAKLDKEYQQIAKGVYQTYYYMQHGELPALENFKPEMLFDIMPPQMRKEVSSMKDVITAARITLANHKNSEQSGTPTAEVRHAYATLTQVLESGAPQCLAQMSQNYTNEFVTQCLKNPKRAMSSQSAEYSLKL